MRIKSILFFIAMLLAFKAESQNNKFLEELMRSKPEWFEKILANTSVNEVQIIYTKIDRDKNNVPHFTEYHFHVSNKEYFYPASTVKLPLSLLALEKLNALNIQGLNKETALKIDSASRKQIAVSVDTSSVSGLPTIGNYIRKILLVSDNESYNRLYEFLGQDYINKTLHQKGFSPIRILHRFSVGDDKETARYTNPMQFYADKKVIYEQPQVYSETDYFSGIKPILKGVGYLNGNDSLINKPFDFTNKNFYPLTVQHQILKSLIFPETQSASKRFNLSDSDYKFVYKYMSMLPRESKHPNYSNSKEYHDSYAKFLLFGDSKEPIPANIRIFNKIGDAYGFMIDNAYIVDFEHNVEFMLSAVINCNSDGIYNDNKYDYETIGYPFMANLGKLIYEYELKREKKHLPDLSKFKFDYADQDMAVK